MNISVMHFGHYYRELFMLDYNSDEVFELINENTACVILETVQAESGITAPSKKWMQQLREKCTEAKCFINSR